jgi:vitamin B12 transporter
MKKEKNNAAIKWIAKGVLFCISFTTYGQIDSVKTHHLDEVVITATKFSKNQSETGKEVSIIDEVQLERSAGKDLAQLLNEQVGIVVNGANSNTGKDKSVYLRGAKGEHTLILIDGMTVNDPSGNGGAYDLRLISLDQIKRIEILKGSQSTLYGSDAIAGVINIITKKGGTKPFGVNGNIGYGTYKTFKGNAGINGRLGQKYPISHVLQFLQYFLGTYILFRKQLR